jgi:multicomponent Na+:H+ antiporter subunit F
MMSNASPILLPALVVLLLTLGAGLVRALRGPTLADRMLAVQLLGTGGVAVLLLLSALLQTPALLEVALVLALLAVVAAAAITRRELGDD